MPVILFIFFIQLTIDTATLAAQNRQRNSVIVKSDPPGAMVYFEGEKSFVGITPFKLRPNFRGKYKILTVKNGYEKRQNEYFFTGKEKGTLRLKLSPKTRFKAGLRSFIFPGWGQFYAERKTTGILMSFLQVGTAIGAVTSIRDYNKAVEDYDNALKTWKDNKNGELDDTYRNILINRYNKADESFSRRQTWIWVASGLWVYNILDSIFFFPSFDKEIFNRSVPTLSTNFQNGTPSLRLTMSF